MPAQLFRTKNLHWLDRVCTVAVLGLIVCFYTWTARPEHLGNFFTGGDNGYYNLLTRGFLKGHLAMDLEADPFLATLKNPYDLAQRAGHGLHDASYYKGKYYLYFGVTPALVLFLPFRLITGVYLDEGAASLFFASLGLLTMVGLLTAVRVRYFSRSPRWVFTAALFGLGLADMMPALLRRASFWEVPITAAHACAVLGLGAIFKAIHSKSRILWIGFGSLALGAAVGARPVYLLGCASLLMPLVFWARGGAWREVAWRHALLAAVGPAALIGIGLALYNWLRFDSPFQFGQNYQMSADGVNPVFFSLSYLWYGVRLYWLEPAGWSPFFPFVTVISPPPPPLGQLGVENPYGILPNIPYIVLALGLLSLFRSADLKQGDKIRLVTWFVSGFLLTGAAMITVMGFGGITNRYMIDFLPLIVFLSCCGWLALSNLPIISGFRGKIFRILPLGLLVYSIFFNVMVSMQHNRLLLRNHPTVYTQVSTFFNFFPALYDQWFGINYGPIEMRVIFPKVQPGTVEPLIVTGRTFLSDYLYVHYLSDDMVRFGYEHTSYGGSTGDAVKINPGEIYTLRIDFGSLYPPPAHPYFAGMSQAQAASRQLSIRVTMNGAEVLSKMGVLYDSVARRPDIGHSGTRASFRKSFSGTIKEWRILPEAAPVVRSDEFGPLLIKAKFPRFVGVSSEPLVSSGERGKGDVIYVKYLDENTVAFGYDHWGVGGFLTAPIKIVPLAIQDIILDYGALHEVGVGRNQKRVAIRLNGQIVANQICSFHECLPGTVVVGANLIGASTAAQVFNGVIHHQARGGNVQAEVFGPLLIKVKLPIFSGARVEPLLCSGEPGKGDLVYIKYVDSNTVVLGYDHWGVGGFETEPLTIDSTSAQHIGIDYGALDPSGSKRNPDRVIFRLNGRVVADKLAGFHECSPDTVVIGLNAIGASTATVVFSGVVLGQER